MRVFVFALIAFAALGALPARAETATIVPPPGWTAQPALGVRGGANEALGFWTGAISENTTMPAWITG